MQGIADGEVAKGIMAYNPIISGQLTSCLLYTSDAADDSLRVDLGGRRIIKKLTVVLCPTASTAFFKQKTAYEIHERLVGSEMCIRDRIDSVTLL